MPEWLQKKTTPDKKYLSAKNGVKEGSRNDSGASMAGKILSACPIELWDTIGWGEFENWNNKNSPPLPLSNYLFMLGYFETHGSQRRKMTNLSLGYTHQ
jgi:hypothetical protein